MINNTRVLHHIQSLDFPTPLVIQHFSCDVSVDIVLKPFVNILLRNIVGAVFIVALLKEAQEVF
jgi:hypothetical protein